MQGYHVPVTVYDLITVFLARDPAHTYRYNEKENRKYPSPSVLNILM